MAADKSAGFYPSLRYDKDFTLTLKLYHAIKSKESLSNQTKRHSDEL
jgi:hypothetical protein